MNRIAVKLGFLAALGAAAVTTAPAPLAAQTHVSVSLGFGVPQPYVSGYVVVLGGRPAYRPWRFHHHRAPLVVLRRDILVLPPRPIVVYRRPYHHRHRRW